MGAERMAPLAGQREYAGRPGRTDCRRDRMVARLRRAVRNARARRAVDQETITRLTQQTLDQARELAQATTRCEQLRDALRREIALREAAERKVQ